MDNDFEMGEELYRAVYPPSHPGLFITKEGKVSSAAFADPKGLSVERGYYREDSVVVEKMKKLFDGCIISVSVQDCSDTNALVKISECLTPMCSTLIFQFSHRSPKEWAKRYILLA